MNKSIFIALIFYFFCQKDLTIVSAADDGVPVIQSVTPISPCILKVTWSCANYAKYVDNFTIYWSALDGDIKSDTVQKVLTYNIDLLLSNKTYGVYVQSTFSNGTTKQSDIETGRTLKGVPTSVQGLKAGDTTDSTIPLTWSNTTNKCPINGFKIEWDGYALWDEVQTASGEYSTPYLYYTISHLIPYATFTIKVSEVTSDGIQGTPKILTNVETQERIAEAPESVNATALSTSSIYVSWETPKRANGIITEYLVSWNGELDDDPTGNKTTSNEVFSTTISGLIACVNFDISVQAVNGAGYGQPGNDESSTDDEVPPAPTIINCTVDGPTAFIVQWDAQDDSNSRCQISGYKINSTVDVSWNGEQDVYSDTLGTDDLSITYDGLYPHSSVYISLAAYTDSYTGDISPCDGTTDDDVPGAPEGLAVVEDTLTATAFTVTWKDPEIKNGLLQSFHIELSNKLIIIAEDDVDYSNFADAYYTYSFNDLNLNTLNYTVSVSASNENFEGESSEIEVFYVE